MKTRIAALAMPLAISLALGTASPLRADDQLALSLAAAQANQPATSSALRLPDESGAMTIDELQRLALANNPTLAQAARRADALRGERLQVGLRPNPVIGYEGNDMGESGSAGQQGMFVEQRIITGGKLGLNRAVVGHEIDQAEQDLEIQRLRILNDVKTRAYDVLVAQQTVSLNERLMEIGDSGVAAAESLFKSKEVSQVDVLQARVEANSARLDLDTARNEYSTAWRHLALAIGTPAMAPTPLADALNEDMLPLTWEDSAARLLADSPEMVRAQAGIERARCALARAQAGRKPDLDLSASLRYGDDTDSTLATVLVGVPLQIYDRNQGNICKAEAELAAAHREVERVELALQDRLAAVFKQYLNGRQQVDQYKRVIVPDAQSSLDLVQTGYQRGEFGYLELLTAQRTYTRVSLAYLQSLQQLLRSRTQVEGLLLTGALERPRY